VEIAINALLTVVGLAMLCFGGNWLVSGGVSIAKKLRISQMVIGLTVVAYERQLLSWPQVWQL